MELIYTIPGLGTTQDLFQNTAVQGHELKVLSWPEPKKEYTLTDYANEFIKQIDTSKPVNLMGVSFGGMLCSALADVIDTKKVILISSCKNRLEFPAFLKTLNFFSVNKFIPEKELRTMAKHSRLILGFEKELEPLFFKMVDSMPENYFSHCVNYIINWNKTKNNPDIISIHGTADRLLTANSMRTGYTVKNGSHAMILNKADEINTILNKEFNEH